MQHHLDPFWLTTHLLPYDDRSYPPPITSPSPLPSPPLSNMALYLFLAGVGFFGAKHAVRFAQNLNIARPAMGPQFDKFQSIFQSKMSQFRTMTADVSGFENTMSKKEAYQILNVNPTVGKDKIKENHRMLMLKNHPDNGGTNYIASKINEAKIVLIGGK